mmetsp:Transcript_28008/g.82358  ORF Transcript_28008/g.82358 Transcript_28008/m.82358 type:complete len:260 (-) Transcript_28008:358-1137(-)
MVVRSKCALNCLGGISTTPGGIIWTASFMMGSTVSVVTPTQYTDPSSMSIAVWCDPQEMSSILRFGGRPQMGTGTGASPAALPLSFRIAGSAGRTFLPHTHAWFDDVTAAERFIPALMRRTRESEGERRWPLLHRDVVLSSSSSSSSTTPAAPSFGGRKKSDTRSAAHSASGRTSSYPSSLWTSAPSCPRLPLPQPYSRPSSSSANPCCSPNDTETMGRSCLRRRRPFPSTPSATLKGPIPMTGMGSHTLFERSSPTPH